MRQITLSYFSQVGKVLASKEVAESEVVAVIKQVWLARAGRSRSTRTPQTQAIARMQCEIEMGLIRACFDIKRPSGVLDSYGLQLPYQGFACVSVGEHNLHFRIGKEDGKPTCDFLELPSWITRKYSYPWQIILHLPGREIALSEKGRRDEKFWEVTHALYTRTNQTVAADLLRLMLDIVPDIGPVLGGSPSKEVNPLTALIRHENSVVRYQAHRVVAALRHAIEGLHPENDEQRRSEHQLFNLLTADSPLRALSIGDELVRSAAVDVQHQVELALRILIFGDPNRVE